MFHGLWIGSTIPNETGATKCFQRWQSFAGNEDMLQYPEKVIYGDLMLEACILCACGIYSSTYCSYSTLIFTVTRQPTFHGCWKISQIMDWKSNFTGHYLGKYCQGTQSDNFEVDFQHTLLCEIVFKGYDCVLLLPNSVATSNSWTYGYMTTHQHMKYKIWIPGINLWNWAWHRWQWFCIYVWLYFVFFFFYWLGGWAMGIKELDEI